MSRVLWNYLLAIPGFLIATLVLSLAGSATEVQQKTDQTHLRALDVPVIIPTNTTGSSQAKSSQSVVITNANPNNKAKFSRHLSSQDEESKKGKEDELFSLAYPPHLAPQLSKETSRENSDPKQVTSTQAGQNTVAQQVPATGNRTANPTEVLEQIQRYNSKNSDESRTGSLDQITNVTQLRDVRPSDWAYEALRSLVERYGCIAGYPDGTFRGNRATSRYEFAAGLNACLSQIERLIASNTADFVRKQDLETLQRLIEEFRSELTTLGTRVNKLQDRTAFLEQHQFSTTTRLNGEVLVYVSDLFGDRDLNGNKYSRTNAVIQDRVRLNFDTSFTGKDRLRTRLQARNATAFGPFQATNTGPGTNITKEGRIAIEGTDPGGPNSIYINNLSYRFPLGKQFLVQIIANSESLDDIAPTLNALENAGIGSVSWFGLRNPLYRIGAGLSGAGASVSYGPSSPIRVDLGYVALSSNNPTVIGTVNNPGEDSGLFNGNYSAIGQVTFRPSKAISLAATYVQTYDRRSLSTGAGSNASQLSVGRPVVGNTYGLEASFALSPKLILSGWAGYTRGIILGTGTADVWNYAATLAINDLGGKGNTLGFVVGMEPKLTGTSSPTVGRIINGLGAGRRSDRDTGLHVEGFYRLVLTDNISITPGVIWLTAPGHDDRNDDIFVGTIRTTFTF